MTVARWHVDLTPSCGITGQRRGHGQDNRNRTEQHRHAPGCRLIIGVRMGRKGRAAALTIRPAD